MHLKTFNDELTCNNSFFSMQFNKQMVNEIKNTINGLMKAYGYSYVYSQMHKYVNDSLPIGFFFMLIKCGDSVMMSLANVFCLTIPRFKKLYYFKFIKCQLVIIFNECLAYLNKRMPTYVSISTILFYLPMNIYSL